MIFWSLLDQNKCMEWQLCDIIAVSLNVALYIRVKSTRYKHKSDFDLNYLFVQLAVAITL